MLTWTPSQNDIILWVWHRLPEGHHTLSAHWAVYLAQLQFSTAQSASPYQLVWGIPKGHKTETYYWLSLSTGRECMSTMAENWHFALCRIHQWSYWQRWQLGLEEEISLQRWILNMDTALSSPVHHKVIGCLQQSEWVKRSAAQPMVHCQDGRREWGAGGGRRRPGHLPVDAVLADCLGSVCVDHDCMRRGRTGGGGGRGQRRGLPSLSTYTICITNITMFSQFVLTETTLL